MSREARSACDRLRILPVRRRFMTTFAFWRGRLAYIRYTRPFSLPGVRDIGLFRVSRLVSVPRDVLKLMRAHGFIRVFQNAITCRLLHEVRE
jgi:hypothetical protein